MRKLLVLSTLIVVLLAVAPAHAQGNNFKFYAAANYVVPTGSSDIDIDDVIGQIEASTEAGWSVGFEWRTGKWFGLELDYLQAEHDLDFEGETVASTSMSPLSASLNFHLVHTKIIDLYLGPTASYFDFGDIEVVDGDDVSADSEWGYGAQIGMDFSLIKSVAIVTGIRYTTVEVSAEGDSITVDPLFAKVGIPIRF
jgi:outer membrane protein W